jgi:hypothetical protein
MSGSTNRSSPRGCTMPAAEPDPKRREMRSNALPGTRGMSPARLGGLFFMLFPVDALSRNAFLRLPIAQHLRDTSRTMLIQANPSPPDPPAPGLIFVGFVGNRDHRAHARLAPKPAAYATAIRRRSHRILHAALGGQPEHWRAGRCAFPHHAVPTRTPTSRLRKRQPPVRSFALPPWTGGFAPLLAKIRCDLTP